MADQDDSTSGAPAKQRVVTPGISGAIYDAVNALAKAFAPPQITQRGKKIDQAVDQASQSPQTTDLGNQF